MGAADSDTDGPGEASSSGPDPMAQTGSGTGGDPSDDDGTGGTADGTADGDESTGEDGSTGEEMEPTPYRIVYTSAETGVTRLYSATDDFSQIESLTSSGVDPVDMSTFARRPRLHADRRHLMYVRGSSALVLDVFSGGEITLPIDATTIVQRDWSPTDLEMSVLDEDRQLLRVAADGSAEVTSVYDFTDDTEPTDSLEISWSPLGDRFAVRSRPDGGNRVLWMVDAEGQDAEPVFAPVSSISPYYGWTVEGDRVWWVADASAELAGRELGIGNPGGYILLSEGHANVETQVRYAADGSRLVFMADSGLVSVLPDGSGQAIVGPTVGPDASWRFEVSDDGSLYAMEIDGRLIAGTAGMFNVVELHAAGVGNPRFVPGGTRLAYTLQTAEDAPRRLYIADGNGPGEVSVELLDDEHVMDFGWFHDGVMYLLATADGHTGLFHTDAGDTPLFVPEPGEVLSLLVSDDENRLVVKAVVDGTAGRLCTLDTTDMTAVDELGCTDFTIGEGSGSTVTVAHDTDAG